MNLNRIQGSRTRILAIGIIVIGLIFVARLFYIQVIQNEFYVAKAADTQQSRFIIPAERGLIYAKNGDEPVQLVMNQTVFTVFADPETVTEPDEIMKYLREIAGGNMRDNAASLLTREGSRYEILATKLSRTQADALKEKELSGLGFQAVSQRVYPEGALAGQVLGFVNAEGVGNYGVEQALNDRLQGKDGVLQTVTDVSNVPLTIGDDNVLIPEQDGADIVLSIDRNVQSKVEDALRAGARRTGASDVSAVVMDPATGKVLAMANYPSYNPGEYFNVRDIAVFNNRTISAPYEPGSTIKAFTLATAVDKNVVKPTDTFVNTDSIRIADRTISNATKGITGTITFQTAMQWSLNTGFVTIAQRLGNGSEITPAARETMYEYFYNKFRLGQATGIELSGEASGAVVAPSQPTGNAVRYSNMSFGQGMDATMLQVASSFTALINGGAYYKPTIIDGEMKDGDYVPKTDFTPVASNLIKESTSETIREVLVKARQAGFPGADRRGYDVGGKTGTSQVIKNGAYSATETIASYVGFGGGDRPEYVIMVQVAGENREYQGARDALPIFTDISNWMIEYLKIQPKG